MAFDFSIIDDKINLGDIFDITKLSPYYADAVNKIIDENKWPCKLNYHEDTNSLSIYYHGNNYSAYPLFAWDAMYTHDSLICMYMPQYIKSITSVDLNQYFNIFDDTKAQKDIMYLAGLHNMLINLLNNDLEFNLRCHAEIIRKLPWWSNKDIIKFIAYSLMFKTCDDVIAGGKQTYKYYSLTSIIKNQIWVSLSHSNNKTVFKKFPKFSNFENMPYYELLHKILIILLQSSNKEIRKIFNYSNKTYNIPSIDKLELI